MWTYMSMLGFLKSSAPLPAWGRSAVACLHAVGEAASPAANSMISLLKPDDGISDLNAGAGSSPSTSGRNRCPLTASSWPSAKMQCQEHQHAIGSIRSFASDTVPYARRSGTPRPTPWPVFERIKEGSKERGSFKWHRTLYRFPQDMDVSLDEQQLTLSGRAGMVALDLAALDPSGLLAFKMISLPSNSSNGASSQPRPLQSMLAVASPDKQRFQSFVDELEASVRGVTVGYLVGLTVKGVGYRMEPMEESPRKRSWYFDDDKIDRSAIVYPHPTPVPAVRLKVGYSRTAVFPLPPGIRAFCIKPTLLYLYGLRKEQVDATAAAVRQIRRPNVYTGNGIQRVDEVVRIKQRKASK